jgi:hypothetical protein
MGLIGDSRVKQCLRFPWCCYCSGDRASH